VASGVSDPPVPVTQRYPRSFVGSDVVTVTGEHCDIDDGDGKSADCFCDRWRYVLAGDGGGVACDVATASYRRNWPGLAA